MFCLPVCFFFIAGLHTDATMPHTRQTLVVISLVSTFLGAGMHIWMQQRLDTQHTLVNMSEISPFVGAGLRKQNVLN